MGESMFARLLEDLRSAEHFIFMEYFIIEEGHFWNSILEILKEKAAAGVEVKVVYDDIGCMMTLPGDYFKTLRGFGCWDIRSRKLPTRSAIKPPVLSTNALRRSPASTKILSPGNTKNIWTNRATKAVYVHAPDNSSGHRVQDGEISYNYIGILPATLLYDLKNGKTA